MAGGFLQCAIIAPVSSGASGHARVTYTTTAASEREARSQLPAVRLVFVARIRMEVQSHA
ncbi:host cell division inhibitor Icd-like protein [Salmonella enterica]|nr:host cell division inhibitor Icd-like protein [Salmonella enterica]EKS3672249.1 host cell division inhibitor Icd-like protein [Salmonella enterica]ELW6561707.1 host cell division inhibitor Icd-like protein [Salmonella enterica]ELZ1405611.1 host cell division inhibitor Icd-like protein [Salmonella enterica]